jgi:hypothetical protein
MYGFLEHTGADARLETGLAHNIDARAQYSLQFADESGLIKQRGVRAEPDKEIDVGIRTGFAPGDGAKDADIIGTVTFGDPQDLFPALTDDLRRRHVE